MKEAIINLSKVVKERGLNNHIAKTKCMEVTKRPSNSRMLKVDDQKFERVREFKYLGSALTEDIVTIEIKQRTVVAN
jgi:hypothetical protein